ncbi:hypothetical protein DL89DRAFT_79610 [Linderina pennispora]|uniref:Uncharacterized protein n=1 Tax=Linderina pennispora TaxID=61395 RepID=A0A1Y1VR22_9FUNG|nr:uncharacterized protein DL89DRAFT_79610 [Linderina pennispora]ORX63495.1 hypothetical protein DL89DRAFT_79610 [Linderina pennispora]
MCYRMGQISTRWQLLCCHRRANRRESLQPTLLQSWSSNSSMLRMLPHWTPTSLLLLLSWHRRQPRFCPDLASQELRMRKDRHSSRISGLFGFGQRTPKHQTQAQQAGGSLRVVTDLQSLRGASSNGSQTVNTSMANHASINTGPSSSDSQKKSGSPSTVSRRWRFPFQKARPAIPIEDADAAAASDQGGNDSEAATPSPLDTAARRTLRQSRYRAGTTSDIESPQTASSAAAQLSASQSRPYSMVESGSSAVSPASATTTGSGSSSATSRGLRQAPPQLATSKSFLSTQSSSSQRARAMHMLQSTSPISPLMGHMLKPRRRSSANTGAG